MFAPRNSKPPTIAQLASKYRTGTKRPLPEPEDSPAPRRLSDVTRRVIARREAAKASPLPPLDASSRPKRLPLGEVINAQTGSPAHKSKRTKAHHEYAERKPRPSTVKPPVPLPSVNVAKAYKVAKERQKKRLAPPKKAVVSKPDQSEKKPQNDTFVTNTPLGRIRRTRRNNCASQPFAKPHKPTQFEVVDTPQPVFLIEIDPDAMQIDAHAAERHDMMMVPEYAEEIFAVMKCQEDVTCATPGYFESGIQPYLTWGSRIDAVNWIVELHDYWNMVPETLHLAINVLDRILSLKTVSKANLQLVASACLMLASKYEQGRAPSTSEIAKFCDGLYSTRDFMNAEAYIFGALDYDLNWPSPLSFMRRINSADGFEISYRIMTKYLMEAALYDPRFVGAKPSLLAAAAYYLSLKVCNSMPWTEEHVRLSSYTEPQLHNYAHMLLEVVSIYTVTSAVYKYADQKYSNASTWLTQRLAAEGYRVGIHKTALF